MKSAVLMINIGSPESLEHKDVYDYLIRFLMDPRVIDYPYWLRYLLIKKIIVPKRASNSKEAYESIWLEEGSPLLVHTQKLIDRLNQIDNRRDWFMAMRYSNPGIKEQLQKIMEQAYEEIIIFPAYPQFADSSTSSSLDEVKKHLKSLRTKNAWEGEVSYIADFYEHPEFIKDILKKTRETLKEDRDFDKYIFSFHGLPEKHLTKIHPSCEAAGCRDSIKAENRYCYKAQCYQTAHLVAEGLGIAKDQYVVCFQSRLGPTKWITPYTDVVVEDFAKQGGKKIAVFSLAFVTDCLETLEELDLRLQESFKENGGEKFVRIPCLNEDFLSASAIVETSEKLPLN